MHKYRVRPSAFCVNVGKYVGIQLMIQMVDSFHAGTSNGGVVSWGQGLQGQLGHSDIGAVPLPQSCELPASVTPVEVAAGGQTSCVLGDNGELLTWG